MIRCPHIKTLQVRIRSGYISIWFLHQFSSSWISPPRLIFKAKLKNNILVGRESTLLVYFILYSGWWNCQTGKKSVSVWLLWVHHTPSSTNYNGKLAKKCCSRRQAHIIVLVPMSIFPRPPSIWWGTMISMLIWTNIIYIHSFLKCEVIDIVFWIWPKYF
jgi:hypothetical protein